MCIFSGPVFNVSETKIFARKDGNKQFIVYQMMVSAKQELSMILPIPTPQNTSEEDLEFFDLASYPEFFEHMQLCEEPPSKGLGRSFSYSDSLNDSLNVINVGEYDVSFVPSREDFSRLDSRFILDDSVWGKLPQYKSWSFVVFKINPLRAKKFHPFAFSFPTKLTDMVYIPTTHVHDGKVHEREDFDHRIYAQGCRQSAVEYSPVDYVRTSYYKTGEHMNLEKTQGIVLDDTLVYSSIHGSHDNRDVFFNI